MYGGKGGLGKTTLAAATAYALSKVGFKVLTFSVDPQASLSDIFQEDIFGKGEVEIAENLYVCEVDAAVRIAQQQEEVRKKIYELWGLDEIPKEIEDYIKAIAAEPAMEESAIFDAVVEIITQHKYDYYIYDLVPLGHALYYLSMAKIFDAWINKITQLREKMRDYEELASKLRFRKGLSQEDAILKELLYIKERLNFSSSLLTDKSYTAFFFVIVPQEVALEDTMKAERLFLNYNVPIQGYILNRILKEDIIGKGELPSFLVNKLEEQKGVIERIKKVLRYEIYAEIPEFPHDIRGWDALLKVASLLNI
jgi:arsenite-transporting ATPase